MRIYLAYEKIFIFVRQYFLTVGYAHKLDRQTVNLQPEKITKMK